MNSLTVEAANIVDLIEDGNSSIHSSNLGTTRYTYFVLRIRTFAVKAGNNLEVSGLNVRELTIRIRNGRHYYLAMNRRWLKQSPEKNRRELWPV